MIFGKRYRVNLCRSQDKIEGEDIELDSYIKHKAMGMAFKPDYLSIQEVFYYAAFIHLVFVKIHPWDDGNGRSARLLEKWFLAQKLGEKAWFVQSEKMYYQQHQTYYKNIRLVGLEYPELDYNRTLPFLLMLPQSVEYHLKK